MSQRTHSNETEYVLGTGADELERLAFQHRLWCDAAHHAWRMAKIRMGHRVLDVGCGPGFASYDLAQLVTRRGCVVGVDESPRFIEYLNHQASGRHLPQLSGRVGDVHELPILLADQQPFDFAYVRWLLCFVRDPNTVVAGIAKSLKPGGAVVIHDYFAYESMTVAPKSPVHDRVVEATMQSWRDRGGNTDIAGELPRLFAENGFVCEHLTNHARIARGDDTMFHWPELWWQIYAPKLVTMGYITETECHELLALVGKIGNDPNRFIHCPTVYEFVFRKLA
ncbi:MAG: methyltransferase domain-containing protein [Planctomycetaceae bacterium]|nr:methyltransferase domain-containing protein [Planctomycetaceae bacterium]